MMSEQENQDYAIRVFSPDTPSGVKMRKLLFFIGLCLIILIQSCYWLFANSVEPVVIGLPFSMFFIALFIAIEFAALLVLYFIESEEMEE
jgi:phosphoglycerol transferase MdoB-like AlkP superfamily enzyme